MSSCTCWEATPKVNCTGLSPVNITCHGIAKDGKALCGSQEFITKHHGRIYRLSIGQEDFETVQERPPVNTDTIHTTMSDLAATESIKKNPLKTIAKHMQLHCPEQKTKKRKRKNDMSGDCKVKQVHEENVIRTLSMKMLQDPC